MWFNSQNYNQPVEYRKTPPIFFMVTFKRQQQRGRFMSYFVLCSFDLRNASSEDYEAAYSELESLGLRRNLKANNGNYISLPNTTVAGEHNGTSVSQVRDSFSNRIESAFRQRGLSSKIFVSVGDGFAWGLRNT